MRHKVLKLYFLLGFLAFENQEVTAWEFTTPTKPDYVYMAGTGTIEDPYLISSAEELVTLCSYVNSVKEYTVGKYFKLTKDISLNDKVLNEDGTLVADTAQLKKWQPCGHGEVLQPWKTFQGVFDGDNHTISGIYMNDTTQHDLGLFGFLHRGAEIKNLVIKDSYIRGMGAVGALCGQSHYGIITNCTSYATVESVGSTIQVGGLVGSIHGKEDAHTAALVGCTNYGMVTGKSVPDEYGYLYNCYVGGICGDVSSSATVKECINEGVVFANGWGAAGGITGTVTGGASITASTNKGKVTSNARISMGGISGNNWQVIRDCRNEGEVIPMVKGCTIGGISGTCSFNSRIYNSINIADIHSDVDSLTVGGICGNARAESSYGSSYSITISGCINEGNIELGGVLSLAGGICGRNYSADILKSRNSGNITTSYYAAGISPLCEYHSGIEESENTGVIKGGTYIGGIVGKTTDAVVACNNRGSVSPFKSGGTVGGIAAYLSSSSCYVINCFNTGHISNGYMIGGVMGHSVSSGSVRSCYNAGIVSAESKAYIGGVCGYSASVTNSYNVGEVRSMGDNSFVGSISGYSYGSITNCYNMGDVYSSGSHSFAGYLAGDFSVSSSRYFNFRNCYYLENSLHGDNFTNQNINESGLTALHEGDFKTLTSKLNVVEYWGETLPYVQGFYRPVLTNYYEDIEPLYFAVTRVDCNDTVFVDMGRPSDNTFFETDTTGLVTEVFNVITGENSVKNALITDSKDLKIGRSLIAESLRYQRKEIKGYETFCLPFDVTGDDFGESFLLLRPTVVGMDYVVLDDTLDAAKAGQPFILHYKDSTASVVIEKNNVTIVSTTDSLSLLVGSFHTVTPDSLGFILGETDSICAFRRVSNQDSLYAFRAYLKPAVTIDADTLVISSHPKNYKMTYQVDGEMYAVYSIAHGMTIVPIAFPEKEGYTFSGWSEVPATMPAQDVTVTGTFTVNSYTLLYIVDGEEYKKVEVPYGETIEAEAIPTKEGYLFSGWSEIPETMPAHDVTVTGSFEADGIEGVTTETLVDVYTLQGMKVKHQVSYKDLDKILPKGIYIINGRKVVVK